MTQLIKHLQGFDDWANNQSGLAEGWSVAPSSNGPYPGAGRFTGQALGYNGGYRYQMYYSLPQTGQTKLTIGVALKSDAWSSWYQTGVFLHYLQGNTGSPGNYCGVDYVNGSNYRFQYIDTQGHLYPIYNFSTPANNAWSYFEASLNVDGAGNGTLIFRQDGSVLFSGPVTNAVTEIDFIEIGSPGSGGSINLIDDVYVYNQAGLDNVFCGPLAVYTQSPTADVSNSGSWVPSSGTALYDMVNGSNLGSITGTITTAVGNAEALFDVGTLTTGTDTIIGVQPMIYATGAGATIAGVVVSNGHTFTTPFASAFATAALLGPASAAIELDPNTGQRWTSTGINSAAFGLLKGNP